jgi:hypothetical protein
MVGVNRLVAYLIPLFNAETDDSVINTNIHLNIIGWITGDCIGEVFDWPIIYHIPSVISTYDTTTHAMMRSESRIITCQNGGKSPYRMNIYLSTDDLSAGESVNGNK